MKTTMKPPFLATALLTGALCLSSFAGPHPGEIDFDKFAPAGTAATLVEVKLKSSLISLAAKFVESEEPEVAKLLRSLQLVRVNVFDLHDELKEATEKRMQDLGAHLDKKGWERIVTVKEKTGEDVGVFVKMRGQEAFEGLVITVTEGRKKEAVFVNIVGDLKPEDVAAVGKALNIEPLRKAGEALKKKK
jgi:hypothetical protein